MLLRAGGQPGCVGGGVGHSWLGSPCLPEPPGSEGEDCRKEEIPRRTSSFPGVLVPLCVQTRSWLRATKWTLWLEVPFFFFLAKACGILVPQPRIESWPWQ